MKNDSPRATSPPRKNRVGHILVFLITIVFIWAAAGFLATVPVAGNHPYWRTFRGRPEDFGLKAENVSFVSTDGIPLKGWWIAAQGTPRGTVIIAHGINGNRSDMLPRAAFLVRDGYNTLLLDLRDHGESGGTYAGPGYRESCDILGALKYLRNRGETGSTAVMGHSYGAVAALYAAAQSSDIAAVISDSAFISFGDMVKRATTLLFRGSGAFVLGAPGAAVGTFSSNRVGRAADLLSSNRCLARRQESECACGDFAHWQAANFVYRGRER